MKNKLIKLTIIFFVLSILTGFAYVKTTVPVIDSTTDFLIEGSNYIIVDMSELNPIDISEWKTKYRFYNLNDVEKQYYKDIIEYVRLYNKYIVCDSIDKSKEYEKDILKVYDRILNAYNSY